MQVTLSPRVKICCISSLEEAQMAIKYGAAALGLVGDMPSGPGIISDTQIASIAQAAPPPLATFLLTSKTEAQAIIAHQKKVNTNTIQIVDALERGTYQDIKKALPSIKLVQVIHVVDEQALEEAQQIAPYVDALLLDSGNPNLEVKELGGTGRVHNWEISQKIRATVSIPIFLAGGLNANNVQEAMHRVRPFGLDLCSGVRTDKKLDEEKLSAFMQAVKEASSFI